MGRLAGLSKLALQLSRSGVCNIIPRRGLKFQVDLKWVYPEKKPVYHPLVTGDLASMPVIPTDRPKLNFEDSEELKTASEDVKKIFSLDYQLPKNQLVIYTKELVDKVKRHQFDTKSLEIRIAKLTAKIRYFQPVLEANPYNKQLKHNAGILAAKRKKYLKLLRLRDYKKFEWLLEQLDLEYKPVVVGDKSITRKKSLVLLARLKLEKEKEAKLAVLKKSYDEQKVPFLQKKIEKLKWIKEMEEKHNLPKTVSDEDIDECVQKLERVKIEVSERMKENYERKIHPYLIEPYNEKLLLEKERNSRKEEVNS